MKLQQIIRRILKEETQGINNFINTLESKFNLSDELKQFLINFIENSNCKNIEFSNFKIPAEGMALYDKVLINNRVLTKNLELVLFVIFHEIAHQYQFKKYGVDKMHDIYNGEISIEEGAKFMKYVEEVADNFAYRKIRELQKKGMIDKSFIPPQLYKTIDLSYIKTLVSHYRTLLSKDNITSHDKISEFFYNMVKSEL